MGIFSESLEDLAVLRAKAKAYDGMEEAHKIMKNATLSFWYVCRGYIDEVNKD